MASHMLVPEHKKLPVEDKKKLLAKYNISSRELPKILFDDPAIQHLNAEPGDVIKVIRKSPTAGTAYYYRVVIRG